MSWVGWIFALMASTADVSTTPNPESKPGQLECRASPVKPNAALDVLDIDFEVDLLLIGLGFESRLVRFDNHFGEVESLRFTNSRTFAEDDASDAMPLK